MGQLSNRTIAVLSESGFEEVELTEPVKRLKEEGATVHIISSKSGKIRAWDQDHWSIEVDVDKTISEANAEDYHGLLLPGGVINPDQLRVNEDAIAFVKSFFSDGKPVAAICHGPQTLINAEVVEGRKLTSVKNISKDLIHAGALWSDEEVVVDQGLVTSRTPEDLPAFNDKIVEEFAEGVHEGQHA
ncbi:MULTISPECIES: type 1 glutamine amidotransferase domain-containing protein [unclassified Pedobacter]|jgi:protease I|uniref:type 1 glutamine amidotransferase domain-containing protein n=1 Tax=Pedobacter TaxID=84567 RepID=UPI000B4BD32B|nr:MULTISPECIES: type 1 glutamine amidotransferase domain-containing protein [unclassified Pedobacter]MCX2432272.1 type 1 glutamine amidotransferase [Pedobacter sp. GR22-10]MCX2582805.1 type 1 glutamine amidotransferase [Pedobacter sp. MR22-3]OWK71327.1 protease [Pedobacter sp. AJM]